MGKRNNSKFSDSKDNDFKGKSKKFPKKRNNFKEKWDKDENSPSRNDISWYTPDTQILNDAGRWPYSRPVGTPLSRDSILHIADVFDGAVPGVCVAHTYITPGVSVTGHSALNVAANAVYTFVRHVNSGSRNYDANDLMIYIGSVDSIYAYVTYMSRTYSTASMFASMNKYVPDELCKLCGIDINDIRSNMANWRARFNSLLLKIGTLVVPDSLPIFRRHSFMFQNYYQEGPSIKDQLYFYNLLNVYKFKLDSTGAGMLENVHISTYADPNTGLVDAEGTLRILEDLITPIFNDEDFNIMSGDILKAYDGKILSLMLLPELTTTIPINNVAVLEQFKNLRCLGGLVKSGDLDITQDANKEYLISRITDCPLGTSLMGGAVYASDGAVKTDIVKVMEDEWSRPIILTTELTDASPEVNMLNTRCIAYPEVVYDSSQPTSLGIKDVIYGSELVAFVSYASHDKNWNLVNFYASTVMTCDMTSTSELTMVNFFKSLISSFRFHPAHIVIGVDSSASPATYNAPGLPDFGIDNFTTIDFDHVKTLHDVAILGEYNVPRLAVLK